MAIYPDKKGKEYTGRWRVEVQLGGKRLRGRFDTKAEAEAAEKEFQGQLEAGDGLNREDLRHGPRNLSEALDIAAPTLWAGKVSYDETLSRARTAVRILGNKPIKKVATADIDRVITALSPGRRGATVNRHLSALHKLLRWCQLRGYLVRMPSFAWKLEGGAKRRALTAAEEASLLGLLESYGAGDVADFCRVSLATGMRRGELINLRPEDIQGNWAHLKADRTKTRIARSVPLAPEVQEILHKRLPWRFSIHRLRHFWARAKADMGLEADRYFVPHAMRHTTCARLINTHGVNTMVAKHYLGHKRVTTTELYAHVHDESLLLAASILTGIPTGTRTGATPCGNDGGGANGGGTDMPGRVSTPKPPRGNSAKSRG